MRQKGASHAENALVDQLRAAVRVDDCRQARAARLLATDGQLIAQRGLWARSSAAEVVLDVLDSGEPVARLELQSPLSPVVGGVAGMAAAGLGRLGFALGADLAGQPVAEEVGQEEHRVCRLQRRGAACGDELEEHYRQRSMLKRSVLPEDIAEAVAFLASPDAGRRL